MRISREVRGYLLYAGAFFVVLEALLWVAILWWPSFEENTAALKQISSPLPMLTDQLNLIERIGVGAYVVGQHFFKGCNTLGIAAAVLFAMGAVAGEAQRGTLEAWLARPVSRLRLYSERYCAGQLALWVPIMAATLTIPALLTTVDEKMGYADLARCAVHQSLFLGVIYSLTFMLSARGSQPVWIAMTMLFLAIFEFAIYMVKTITHYSVFRWVDIESFAEILKEDALAPWVTLSLIGLHRAPYLVGLACFQRRLP